MASHKCSIGLQSVHEYQESARSCSAHLEAGTLESSTCPPEGGRYINQKQVLTHTLQGLKPFFFRSLNVAAEAATHKDPFFDSF